MPTILSYSCDMRRVLLGWKGGVVSDWFAVEEEDDREYVRVGAVRYEIVGNDSLRVA